MEELFICTICKTEKAANEFYVNKSRHNGLHSRCISCDKKRDRKEYMRKYMSEDRKKNPEKWSARIIARTTLKRQPCVVCTSPKSEAHHEDYSKPLDVIWLCHKHHFDVERGFLKLINT